MYKPKDSDDFTEHTNYFDVKVWGGAARPVLKFLEKGSRVVVSGSLPTADGSHSLYCAVIVKQVDERTRSKTSVNELLRGAVE